MTTARFWRENDSRYNLIGAKCGFCGRSVLSRRGRSARSATASAIGKMEPFKLKGKGEVYSFSVVHEAPSQFELQKPYVIAMIQMDEG